MAATSFEKSHNSRSPEQDNVHLICSSQLEIYQFTFHLKSSNWDEQIKFIIRGCYRRFPIVGKQIIQENHVWTGSTVHAEIVLHK